MNKIVRVLEVLVSERDHVHDVSIYEPSDSLTERLDTLFGLINTNNNDASNNTQGDNDASNSNQGASNNNGGTDTMSNTVIPLG